ncbi:hypothetical protein [Streptomyces fildesensis]|uniref:hypothetical protein n=1 Tax=Streptomyces fildesensis TaxID=375757 RepID=UPI001E4DD664|nr:hypothetical protein [Streptomyces fildesensis]
MSATANVGRRMLHVIWHGLDARGRAALDAAVRDAVLEPDDADAAGALRQQIKRALREEPELLWELSSLLPVGGSVTVVASGNRAIAAHTIGTAITGDNITIRP